MSLNINEMHLQMGTMSSDYYIQSLKVSFNVVAKVVPRLRAPRPGPEISPAFQNRCKICGLVARFRAPTGGATPTAGRSAHQFPGSDRRTRIGYILSN